MAMAQQPRQFHPLPVIGYPESYYAKHIKQADAAGDTLAHAAYKAGQYITLALDPKLSWAEKSKYLRHTIKHHCQAPADAEPEAQGFYQKLRDLVCHYASREALRMANHEHDGLSMRLDMGEERSALEEEAEVFFTDLMGHGVCPDYVNPEVWEQIATIRNQWI